MARTPQEQGPSANGAVPILDDTREIPLVGRVEGAREPDNGKKKKSSSTLTRLDFETTSAPPFFAPDQLLVLGTAILVLNRESASFGRADRLGVRFPKDDLASMEISGIEFAKRNRKVLGDLEHARGPLWQSLQQLITHKDLQIDMAEITLEPSFRERLFKRLGRLDRIQLRGLQKIILIEPLPFTPRPSINFAKHPWIAR